MEDDSLSNLLCQEVKTCLSEENRVLDNDDDDDTSINLKNYSVSNDYIDIFLDREISFGSTNQESLEMSNWVKFARLNAIEWIFKTRAFFEFHFQTAYLSMSYFDRFLSRRIIDSEKTWAIPLLSMACLSLAAKMEECKVPLLSEFQFEDYYFESRVIQRMELMVLNTLEWRMNSITPFAFIHYFITKFNDDNPPKNVVSRVVQLILAIIKEVNLLAFRPSVIAAAATLVSLDHRLTKAALECKINSITSCGFLEIEGLYLCYQIMQKQQIKKHEIPNSVTSPDLSPVNLICTDVYEVTPDIPNSISTKRRRLTYNVSD